LRQILDFNVLNKLWSCRSEAFFFMTLIPA
jgi:hypothetical protein